MKWQLGCFAATVGDLWRARLAPSIVAKGLLHRKRTNLTERYDLVVLVGHFTPQCPSIALWLRYVNADLVGSLQTRLVGSQLDV